MCQWTFAEKQFRERFQDAGRVEFALKSDRKTFTSEFIDDRQHPKSSAVAGLIGDKVIRPDVFLVFRSKSETRAVTQP